LHVTRKCQPDMIMCGGTSQEASVALLVVAAVVVVVVGGEFVVERVGGVVNVGRVERVVAGEAKEVAGEANGVAAPLLCMRYSQEGKETCQCILI
jgi:hypothetical protein